MKTIVSLLLALCLISSCKQQGSAENPSTLIEAVASDAGMSETRLMRIDDMINRAIEEEQIPGAVALVARNGKIVYHKSFGMAEVESSRIFREDDIFRIASQTKAITSTAVMMLWEEGLFRLDDPISGFIPEFENVLIFQDGDYFQVSQRNLKWFY